MLVLLRFRLLCADHTMVLGQEVCELLEGRLLEHSLLPEVWGEVGVGLPDGCVGGLGEVTEGAGGSSGRGVAILYTSHLEQLLGNRGGHDAGTAGGRDQAHPDGAALASHLARNCVWFSDLVSPEPPPDWHDGELGQYDCATDSGSNLLTALDPQPHVAVVVSNGDESLEPSPLPGPGLLLDRHDLQNFILEGRTDEHVDDLELLDGHGEQVDLLQRLDLSILDETSQLGDGDPFLLLLAPSSASATSPSSVSTSSSISSISSPTTSSITKSSTETSSIGWSLIRHY